MAERVHEIFGIDRRKAILTGVAALVLAVAAVTGIGQVANLHHAVRALERANQWWFPVCLGGVLLAAFGLSVTYLVDVATFLVGLACLWLMRAVPPPVDAAKPSLRRVLEGLRYASSRQELIGTYVVDMVAMFFGMPMALFPAMAVGFGGASVGLLYASPAVGSLCATLTSDWTKRVERHGLAVAVAAASWGVVLLILDADDAGTDFDAVRSMT